MTTETKIETVTITVEAGWINEAVKRLTKAADKAERFGLPRPSWIVGAVYERQQTLKSGKKVMAKVRDILVQNTVVKLPGRELVASMETTENGNFLKVREGFELPERFRTTSCYCDHCKTDRARKNLYVFKVEDGSFEQIGSTCLKDYMGFTPASLAYAVSFVSDLRDLESESWGLGGSRYVESTLMVIAASKVAIDHQGGYIPRAVAEANSTISTSVLVMDILYPRPVINPTPKQREWIDTVAGLRKVLHKQETIDAAKEAIRFLLEDWKDDGDYAHNVRLLLKNETFTSFDMLAVAASSYAAYLRAHNRLVEIAAKKKAEADRLAGVAKNANHIGKVGDRLKDIAATVTQNFYVSSNQFGDTFLIKFEDTEGNQYAWFTSGKRWLEPGAAVSLTGTVKEHREYKGVKENQLTRCKVELLAQEEEEAA